MSRGRTGARLADAPGPHLDGDTAAEPKALGLRGVLRVSLLALLVAAPLAFGAVHAFAYVPLLLAAGGLGAASWARAHWSRANGVAIPPVPGRRLILLLHALVIVQLIPLPLRILSVVSPGSFRLHEFLSLGPLRSWMPITVSAPDTLRGLAFLAGMSLIYAAVFRDFAASRWRKRLAACVVMTGLLMTLEALVQARSANPTKIYGLWKPEWDWGVFGPYVSKNHFAGYLALAIPLAFAFVADAFDGFRRAWRRRRIGWIALGDREGNRLIWWIGVASTLMVGLVAAHSRGGLIAVAVSSVALLCVLQRRSPALVALLFGTLAALVLVGSSGLLIRSFGRGASDSRLAVWSDAPRMLLDFPALGSGLNTFGTSYLRYQTVWKGVWFGEAHNEYLQALLDMGVLGAAVTVGLVGLLLRTAFRGARRDALSAGLFASLVAGCTHNLVDFNWQIPANAATFAALAGLAMQAALAERRAA